MSKMSKVVKCSALALSLLTAYAQAGEQAGGVKLTGNVFAGTCHVAVNSKDATTVPEFSLGSLSAADAKTAAVGSLVGTASTDIVIEVSGCADNAQPKNISFTKGVYGTSSNGGDSYENSLIGSTDAATGVNAAIVTTDATPAAVTFGQELELNETSDPEDPEDAFVGNVVLKAQFVKASDTITSGSFESVATFDINYD